MRKLSDETIRCHVHLYKRDVERVKALFLPRMNFNSAVRELVKQMLDRIEAQARAKHRKVPELDLALED